MSGDSARADGVLHGLNETQRAAVVSDPGRCALVLAGAGTGKTRVLTHRYAWLVESGHARPGEILTVTFTNKAAAEMRERICQLLERPSAGGLWIGTFHAQCRRMLQRFHAEAQLPAQFQILDRGDQSALVRQVLADRGMPAKRREVRDAVAWISRCKGSGLRPQSVAPDAQFEERLLPVYEDYERRCRRGGMADFDELLLRALELVRDHEEVQRHYRRRFRHMLADEFQDTNELQYAWMQLLAGAEIPLFVVGDDDQSIYSWRGARPDYMLQFERKHPGSARYALERNYRSTKSILDVANRLIEDNKMRLRKSLRPNDAGDPAPVEVQDVRDEIAEADTVVAQIRRWQEQGGNFRDCAVLYRTNRQSQPLEAALARAGVPYRVYGGLRFFERQEVRDALAYLRLCANPADDVAWERARGAPRRGIGDAFARAVQREAQRTSSSCAQTALRLCAQGGYARAVAGGRAVVEALQGMRAPARAGGLAQTVAAVLRDSGLQAMYQESDRNLGEARCENLDELLNAAAAFEDAYDPADHPDGDALSAFLDSATLDAGERGEGAAGDAAQLMSLHSAKGLEFPFVMVVGLVDGLLPLAFGGERGEEASLEEERRLLYVGCTRAQRRLLLLYSHARRMAGQFADVRSSRFLDGLPLQWLATGPAARGSGRRRAKAHPELALDADLPPPGTAVAHPKFGEGVVLSYEGGRAQLRVQVRFARAGAKWLVYDYARLSPLPEGARDGRSI